MFKPDINRQPTDLFEATKMSQQASSPKHCKHKCPRPDNIDTKPSATPAITISLTSVKNPSDVRRIKLTQDQPYIIGRASKSRNKNLTAASDNALFDCPVVSRSHAELELRRSTNPWSPPTDEVTIRDTLSMHGTSVNGIKVPRGEAMALYSGDRIQLGERVTRGISESHSALREPSHTDKHLPADTHDGIVVKFDREPANAPFTQTMRASQNTFTVPLDSDSEEVSDEYDDDHISIASGDEEVQASSSKTTPEQAKSSPGSSLQPIDVDSLPKPVRQTITIDDDDEYVPLDPPVQSKSKSVVQNSLRIIPDTFAESDFYDDDAPVSSQPRPTAFFDARPQERDTYEVSAFVDDAPVRSQPRPTALFDSRPQEREPSPAYNPEATSVASDNDDDLQSEIEDGELTDLRDCYEPSEYGESDSELEENEDEEDGLQHSDIRQPSTDLGSPDDRAPSPEPKKASSWGHLESFPSQHSSPEKPALFKSPVYAPFDPVRSSQEHHQYTPQSPFQTPKFPSYGVSGVTSCQFGPPLPSYNAADFYSPRDSSFGARLPLSGGSRWDVAPPPPAPLAQPVSGFSMTPLPPMGFGSVRSPPFYQRAKDFQMAYPSCKDDSDLFSYESAFAKLPRAESVHLTAEDLARFPKCDHTELEPFAQCDKASDAVKDATIEDRNQTLSSSTATELSKKVMEISSLVAEPSVTSDETSLSEQRKGKKRAADEMLTHDAEIEIREQQDVTSGAEDIEEGVEFYRQLAEKLKEREEPPIRRRRINEAAKVAVGAAKITAGLVAGGAATFAFLASPLCEKAIEWLA